MRHWGRQDRIGSRLREDIGADGAGIEPDRLYLLDVEFWPRGKTAGRHDLAELRAQLHPTMDERVCDDFIGDWMCLARIKIRGENLDRLLNATSVAQVERPPQPTFDFHCAGQATQADFPTPSAPPAEGPRVCIVDSGIVSNHPLLRQHVGHEAAVLTQTSSPSDAHGHGTQVGAIAVFGDIRAAYHVSRFQSDVTLFSARVLNDQNMFDDERLIENQMEQAIRIFAVPP